MRKICIIADSIDTQYAGGLTYASLLIPALEAAKPENVEITYLHQRPNGFFAGRPEIIVPNARRYPGSDTVRRMIRIPRLLRREGFDLVHDLGHMAPFPRRHESYAKIVTVHDLTPLIMPQAHVRTSRLTHRHLFPRILQHCDHVLTVSDTTRHDVLRLCHPSCPVTAIPLAAKPLGHDLPRPHQNPYILCVSTLEPRKNIHVLLEAFELFRQEGGLHDLVLVGKEGWQVDDLLDRIQRSPYRDVIRVAGFVPDAALGAFYTHADVCVYPSAYEGFGLPVLEAQEAGCPVIVADTAVAREIAGDALRVPVGNVQALQKTITHLLSSPQEARRLITLGTANAAQYTWAKTAAATWAVYNLYVMHQRHKPA